MIAEEYPVVCAQIEALRNELQALKETGLSERYEELIQSQIQTLEEKLISIDAWVNSIEDPAMQAIIRFHFMLGYTWEETNRKLFGYGDRDYCRKRFYKFSQENGLK